MPTTIDRAGEQMARAVKALGKVNGDVQAAGQLLALLGWALPPGVDDIGLSKLDVSALAARLDDLSALRSQEDPSDLELADAVAGVVDALATALAHLGDIAARLQGTPDYASTTGIVDQFFPRLADLLVIQALGTVMPVAVPVGVLLGLFEFTLLPADPAIFQVEHMRQVVRWDRFSPLLTDPADVLHNVYGWGTAQFDGNALVTNIGRVMEHLADDLALRPLPRTVEEQLAGRAMPEADAEPGAQLFVSLAKGLGFEAPDVGFTLYALRATTPGGSDGGVGVSPYVFGTTETRFALSDTLTLDVSASADLEGGLALVLRAGRDPQLLTGLLGTPGNGSPASFALALRHAAPAGGRHVLFSAPGLVIDAAAVTAGVRVTAGASLNPTLSAGIEDGRVRVVPDRSDSFLASILPEDGVTTTLDLEVNWSHRDGLHFRGGAGLRTMLGLHRRAGPLQLKTLDLALTAASDALTMAVTVTGAADLGPLKATVDSVGVDVALRFEQGNLGNTDLVARFRPPGGVGLAIDSGVLKGGGYLFFDPQKAEYAGVLQLRIDTAKFDLTLNAVGLLTTRLPDGSEGYSLIVMITADDFPPIQLPLNFTLNGIGGLFGLHRTVAVDVLRAGLKNKVLDAVLFPEDPLRNAPQLVSNLRAVFPPVRDQYVFGLLAKIGWGTPTRFTVDLGIVLDEPNPTRLIILGQFRTTLPSEKKKIVRINMDALGVIDFDQGEASALATLYDSRIKEYAISGDMAMKMRWKQDPTFILAVGGFHPSFPAPPGLPKLARVGIDLTKGDNPRVRLEAYLAVTSNTVQFGARVDFYVSKSGFSLDGHVGIDTLFQFSPFAMIFDFSLAVTLRWHGKTLMGVLLEASVSGPNPWHLKGRATFEVWIFSKSISFDETFGSKEEMPPLPEVDPLPSLVQALGDARNWSAELPAQRQRLVSLRDATGGGPLLVHPLGDLTVRQQVVPLGKEISKFGNAAPKGARRFQISAVRLHDATVPAQPVQDYFAAGQYEELSQSEQLARPSFELMDAGIRVATGGVAYGGQSDPATMRTLILGYETRTIDADGNVSQGADRYVPPDIVLEAQARLGASARAEGRRAGAARYQAPPQGVALQETQYVVVRKADLAVVETDDEEAPRLRTASRAGGKRRGTSYSAALEALRSHLDRHPEARGALQVVALHEAEKVTP